MASKESSKSPPRGKGGQTAKKYRISLDHHRNYGIKGRGKYGLMIVTTGVSSGNAKEVESDEELRTALASLGYTKVDIDNILELLSESKDFWQETRDFDESAVASLGF